MGWTNELNVGRGKIFRLPPCPDWLREPSSILYNG